MSLVQIHSHIHVVLLLLVVLRPTLKLLPPLELLMLLLMTLEHLVLLVAPHHSITALHLILIHLLIISKSILLTTSVVISFVLNLVELTKGIKSSIFVVRLRKLRILIVHLIQVLHVYSLLLLLCRNLLHIHWLLLY